MPNISELNIANNLPFSGIWCAKLYEHGNFGGWIHEVAVTESDSLGSTAKNDEVSSIKVRAGCTFKGYHHARLGDLMFTATSDKPSLEQDNNDKMTSFSCECSGKKYFSVTPLNTFILT